MHKSNQQLIGLISLISPISCFLFAMLLALAGCDLLSTRDPQPPDTQTTYRTPTTGDIVLANLESSVNARDAVGYTKCFVDSTRGAGAYRFVPAADAQLYAGKFATWSVRDEQSYFVSLKSQVPATSTMSLYLDSTKIESSSSDSTVYSATYTLVAQHNDPSRPTQASGHMHLTVKADPVTQLWAITQWIDVASPPATSWSVMKARFSP